MKKITIFYTGVNGDKNVLMLENPKRAEILFKSGQAIQIEPRVWALEPREYQPTCQKELKRFMNGERGARLDDVIVPKSVQRKEKVLPSTITLYVFYLIIMSEDPEDKSEDPLQKYGRDYTAATLEDAEDMAREEFAVVHWIKCSSKELAEAKAEETQIKTKSYVTIPKDVVCKLIASNDIEVIKKALKGYL